MSLRYEIAAQVLYPTLLKGERGGFPGTRTLCPGSGGPPPNPVPGLDMYFNHDLAIPEWGDQDDPPPTTKSSLALGVTFFSTRLRKEDDHERLALLLGRLRGKFILNYNNVPEVGKLYRKFRIQEVGLRYSAHTFTEGANKPGVELLIRNF